MSNNFQLNIFYQQHCLKNSESGVTHVSSTTFLSFIVKDQGKEGEILLKTLPGGQINFLLLAPFNSTCRFIHDIGALYTMYLVDMTLSILTRCTSMFYNGSFVYLINYLLKLHTFILYRRKIFVITQKVT